MKAVSYGWRQEALAENAQAISELGRELFKRIGDLAGHWSDVDKHLGKSLAAYNKATSTLESRVLVSARRFKDLKAAPDGVDLEPLEIFDRAPRELQAPEFTGREKAGIGELKCLRDSSCLQTAFTFNGFLSEEFHESNGRIQEHLPRRPAELRATRRPSAGR